MTMVVVNVIQDKCPRLRHWQIVIPISIVQFMCGLIYLTPVSTTEPRLLHFHSHVAKTIAGWSTYPELNRLLRSIVRGTSACCTRINNICVDLQR